MKCIYCEPMEFNNDQRFVDRMLIYVMFNKILNNLHFNLHAFCFVIRFE